MRILMVTPYPPLRDGIAAYALQSVARLQAEGHEVEVLSPGPSAAHHHLQLASRRGALALARRARGYDKVIVQFYPGLFHSASFSDAMWASVSAGVAAAFRAARQLEVRIHEFDSSRARNSALVAAAERLMWRAAGRVTVHTDIERHRFHGDYGFPLDRIDLAPHGADFVRRATPDQSRARARLGIPPAEVMFLSIGFIQPHKGFDRAIRAFGPLGGTGCRLDVVGSVRVEERAYVDHVEELRRLVATTPGAALHVGFVSDDEFDEWLVASDFVVLPYREIWSSSVMERAALYDRPVIASRIGGLEAQARPDTALVDSDVELAEAMRHAARAGAPVTREWPQGELADRQAVMAEIRARAAEQRLDPHPERPGAPAPAPAATRWDVGHLGPPRPTSRRPGAALAKRLVGRLDGWQVDPLVEHVNRLRGKVIAAGESLDEHRDSVGAHLYELAASIERIADSLKAGQAELDALRPAVHLLVAEARTRFQSPAQTPSDAELAGLVEQRLSGLYARFEATFRGTSEEIAARQRIYLADVAPLAASGAPVLDIGCGRGEWLELLREHGIPAYGVDTNEKFVELNRRRGLDVRQGDALRHLQTLPEEALAGVVAFHVIEHVGLDTLVDLVDAAMLALVPGGVIVLETPNPTNLVVGSASFYVDPTHRRPVHPQFLEFVLAERGFTDIDVRFLHPGPEQPFEVPDGGGLDTPELKRIVDHLNWALCGPQDYGVVARKPRPGEGGADEPRAGPR